jgi:RND family efflux transporter MFP subunit
MNRIYEALRLTGCIVAIITVLAMDEKPLRANDVDSFTEPYRTINVSTAEQGIITKLLVKEGDTVHEGQLLATLDMDVLEAAKEIAKAGKDSLGRIKSATAAVDLKKERFEKLQALQEEGHAHPEEVLRAKTELEIAQAELLAAEEDKKIKELEFSRIETQIERRKITSPIDGVVTKIHKEVSEEVAATDPIVMTIVQCDQLKVVFPVAATEAGRFSVGQKVAVNFSGGAGATKGLIEVVSHVTDPESGTVRVKVVIDNAQKRYRSGMSCFLAVTHLALTPSPTAPMTTTPTAEMGDEKTEK